MRLDLTREQENEVVETLANGGKVEIHGARMHLATWLLEEGIRLNPFKKKKELMIFNKLRPEKNFDTFIKSLYKTNNNL
jgi:hypothetical protein